MLRSCIVLAVLVACTDHTVVQRPPCTARVYAYDVAVELDDGGYGCLAPWPRECGGQVFDLEPEVPGTQYDCSVADVQRYGQVDEAEQMIPACDAAASTLPCWRTVADASCAEPTHAALEVVRGAIPAPPDNQTIVYCTACLADWYAGS